MLTEVTDLINAISGLEISDETLIFALIIICVVIVFKVWDDLKHDKYYNDMKNEKNKEIERLADDNRRYRDIYLNRLGLTQEQINDISGRA